MTSDKKYYELVEKGWLTAAQKIVDAEAEKAGFSIAKVYHGTTHKFATFSKHRGTAEGDHGNAFYFTSSVEDAEKNYAKIGPDLLVRIDRRTDDLMSGCKLAWGSSGYDKITERSRKKAIKELSGGEERVVTAYLALENPAIVGGSQETILYMESKMDDEGDHVDEPPTGTLIDFCETLTRISWKYEDVDECKLQEAISELHERADYSAIGISETMDFIKEHESLCCASNDKGELARGELVRETLEEMGYDGIIDHTVNSKFGKGRVCGKPMAGVEANTYHIIAFNTKSIKLADPVVKGDDGNIIPPSKRFVQVCDIRGEAEGIALSGKGTQRTADGIKAIKQTEKRR